MSTTFSERLTEVRRNQEQENFRRALALTLKELSEQSTHHCMMVLYIERCVSVHPSHPTPWKSKLVCIIGTQQVTIEDV